MQRVELIIDDLSIDARKADYLRMVHGVEVSDVFEVYNTAPAFFLFDERWAVYDMIGRS